MKTENPLLPYIPSPILVRASQELPDPSGPGEKFMEVEVVLRLRFERMKSDKGKSRNYFWTPDKVDITSVIAAKSPTTELQGQ